MVRRRLLSICLLLDMSQSMYIGDAAGRINGWKLGAARDFSDSDRAFAFNLGIAFQTPEEFFLGESKTTKFVWSGIDPTTYVNNGISHSHSSKLFR